MEARILELIQRPESISAEDLSLLQKEVSRYPYMQSLRTLQLSAVYHFEAEQYPKELTTTAAYTTDKKILYQFINKKKIAEKKQEAALPQNMAVPREEIQDPEILTSPEKEIPENTASENLPFQSEETPVSDAPFQTRKEDLNYTKEKVLEHFDTISERDENLLDLGSSEISFNGFDRFLPDVKFTVPSLQGADFSTKQEKTDPKPKAEEPTTLEPVFVTGKAAAAPQPLTEEPLKVSHEAAKQEMAKAEKTEETYSAPQQGSTWKPMNFPQNPLDSQIQKQEDAPKPAPLAIKVDSKPLPKETAPVEKIQEPKPSERLPENQEAFVQEIPAKALEEQKEEELPSNIPNFVNTWQNWLKIDRSESPRETASISTEKTIEKKSEIIDRFIEDNPRISQLKEESQYVVKEKSNDLSHLMTETLANLYIEQKLYSKAIKGYQALQKRFPEKKEEYKNKIQEIKVLKQNK